MLEAEMNPRYLMLMATFACEPERSPPMATVSAGQTIPPWEPIDPAFEGCSGG